MLPKRRHLVLLVVGTVLVHALVYFLTITGEPYEYAREFAMHDPRVTKVTGSQRVQRLNFWHGYSYSFGDREGSASLGLRVEGDHGKFDLPLVLQKRQGRWMVVSAKAINEKGETIVIVE